MESAQFDRRSNDRQIAILQQKVASMEKNFDNHEKNDERRFAATEKQNEDRFDRMIKFVKEGFDANVRQNNSILSKLDIVYDDKIRRDGQNEGRKQVISFGTHFVSAIWAVVAAAGALIGDHFLNGKH